MVQLTDKWLIVAIIIAIIVIVAGGVIAYYISKKYPSKKAKVDPIYKAFFIWIILLLGYGLIVLLTSRPQEKIQKDIKWLVISLIVLVLFYAVVSYFTHRPIPSFKLWNEYVLPDVKQQWNAEPYVGGAYFTGLILSMVIGVKGKPALVEMGGSVPEKIEVFYGQAYFGNVFPFLAVRNKYTGERLLLAKPPILTTALLHKFLGEELVSSFIPVLSQYDTQDEGIQQPQQQYGVQK